MFFKKKKNTETSNFANNHESGRGDWEKQQKLWLSMMENVACEEKTLKESSCSLIDGDPAKDTVFVKSQSETRLWLKTL